MRFLISKTLRLKQTIVYSYGIYRKADNETTTIHEIAETFHMQPATVQTILTVLNKAGLVNVIDGNLAFNDPTKELFNWTKKNHAQYFPMSLDLIGSASDTAIYYQLVSYFNQGQPKQNSRKLATCLHLDRRNMDRAIKRLEAKGLMRLEPREKGFTILEICESKPLKVAREPKPQTDKPAPKPKPTNEAFTIADIIDKVKIPPGEGGPAYKVAEMLIESGLSIKDVIFYYDLSFETEPIDYHPVIKGFLEEARAQHKGHDNKYCKLFEWKYEQYADNINKR